MERELQPGWFKPVWTLQQRLGGSGLGFLSANGACFNGAVFSSPVNQSLLEQRGADVSAARLVENPQAFFAQRGQNNLPVETKKPRLTHLEAESKAVNPMQTTPFWSSSVNAEQLFKQALAYRDGLDGKQDAKQAAYYFHLAAEKGYAAAQFHLGVCYDMGRGVEQNARLGTR